MPKVSKEHRQAKRGQILDAALRCFARNGYYKSSMRDICKEAGLSAGAVYLHFRSKEEIMETAFKMNQDARVSRIEKAMEAAVPTEAAATSTKYLFAKLADPVPDKTWQLWVQLLSEATRNPLVLNHIRDGWDLAENQIVDLFGQAVARGEANDTTDFRIMARLWTAVHDGLILQKILGRGYDPVEYAEPFKAFVELWRKETVVTKDKKIARKEVL
jgi:TetR/AcrR family transcriptional regulator, transcriptional repressor of aconitase